MEQLDLTRPEGLDMESERLSFIKSGILSWFEPRIKAGSKPFFSSVLLTMERWELSYSLSAGNGKKCKERKEVRRLAKVPLNDSF